MRTPRNPLRNPRNAATALLVLLGLAAGCKRETATYAVSVPADRLPRSAARRLVFRGQEVPLTLENDGRELRGTFSAPGEKWLSEDLKALQFELETPCGPWIVPYRGLGPSPEKEAEWLRSREKAFKPGSAPIDLSLSIEQPPTALLVHVDRREATGAEVALGKQVLAPGAGLPLRPYSTRREDMVGDVYEVAAPTCAEGKSVRVAGQVVGEVGAAASRSHVAIDVKGGHCYDRTAVSYSSLPSTSLPFLRPKKERLSGQRVIPFDDGPGATETDQVFVGCPSVMTGGRMSCTELSPVACDTAP